MNKHWNKFQVFDDDSATIDCVRAEITGSYPAILARTTSTGP